jgi:predicted RNase H-like HicB family nuclease
MSPRQSELSDVSSEELAEARRYSMCIDWSPEDEVFIASFPEVPFVRTHGATREEAAERGEEVIVAWLTAMKDAGYPVMPPGRHEAKAAAS